MDQDNSAPTKLQAQGPSASVTAVTSPRLCVLAPLLSLRFLGRAGLTLARTPGFPLFSSCVFLLPSSCCTLVMKRVRFRPVFLWPLWRVSILRLGTFTRRARRGRCPTFMRGPLGQLGASSCLICAASPWCLGLLRLTRARITMLLVIKPLSSLFGFVSNPDLRAPARAGGTRRAEGRRVDHRSACSAPAPSPPQR